MELDPDDVFRDDDDDPDNDLYQQRDFTKELVVYLVDASPKMFDSTNLSVDEKDETLFHVALSGIIDSLKTQIINRSYDEVAICFFNTREKKNLQDLSSVFVYNVAERDFLDRPTARLIKEFGQLEQTFSKQIGSKYGIVSGSRENSLYNALWVAQALLRKGSAKTAEKRILLLTNEDDPFGTVTGAAKGDMKRTTLQRAKDAQDLGISIELLPLNRPNEEFNLSLFYAELIGMQDEDLAEYMPLAKARLEDMKGQLKKRIFKKRIVRRIILVIANGLSIEVNTYALIRPTVPGAITWLDSVTNLPLKTERSFICSDTGSLMREPAKRFQVYKNEAIKFSVEELSEIKRVSSGHLRLLGFKPLGCLKDYHNLRPSTFLFPCDKEVIGSSCIFIALHRSMIRLQRFGVAFYGGSSNSRLVALVAQDEIISDGGQVEPPGMHMIYLPYSDDIRHVEEIPTNAAADRATEDQVLKATALIKRLELKDFSVCQFANIAVQKHYAVLQALALQEDEMPEVKDETMPDEEGMTRPAVVKAVEEFKFSIFGDKYDEQSELATDGSRKRKAAEAVGSAAKESAKYDWADLADNGKLKNLTVVDLKYYLTAHSLSTTGKKDVLISRILTHLGK